MKRSIETSDEDSSEDESKFQEAAIAPDTLLQSNKLKSKSKLLKMCNCVHNGILNFFLHFSLNKNPGFHYVTSSPKNRP